MIYSNEDFKKEFEYFKNKENRKHPKSQFIKKIMIVIRGFLGLSLLSSLYLFITQPLSDLSQMSILVLLSFFVIGCIFENLEDKIPKRYENFIYARYRDTMLSLFNEDDSKLFIEINKDKILEKVTNDKGVCGDLILWIYDNSHSDEFIQEISFNKAYLSNKKILEQL